MCTCPPLEKIVKLRGPDPGPGGWIEKVQPIIRSLPIDLHIKSRPDHLATSGNIDRDALTKDMVPGGRPELHQLVVIRAELGIGLDRFAKAVGKNRYIISGAPPVAVLDGVITGNITEIEISTYRLHGRQIFLVYVLIGSNLEPIGLLNLADEVGSWLVSIKCEIAVGIGGYGHHIPIGFLDIDIPISELGLTSVPLTIDVEIFILKATQVGRTTPTQLQPDKVNRGIILDSDLKVLTDTGNDINQGAIGGQACQVETDNSGRSAGPSAVVDDIQTGSPKRRTIASDVDLVIVNKI